MGTAHLFSTCCHCGSQARGWSHLKSGLYVWPLGWKDSDVGAGPAGALQQLCMESFSVVPPAGQLLSSQEEAVLLYYLDWKSCSVPSAVVVGLLRSKRGSIDLAVGRIPR